MKKLILAVIFSAMTFASFAMQATVVSAKGKTEVKNGGAWVALKSGDSLNEGSVIQTGFKSELVLKIKESTVTVAPLSRITLQTLIEREGLNGESGKDETTIFLDTGSLKSNVQKSADRRVGFTVRSPVATASVRGTFFETVKVFKVLKLATTRGSVAFSSNTKSGFSKEILVNAGQSATIANNGNTTSPAAEAQNNSASLGNGTQTAASAERSNSVGAAAVVGGESSGSSGGGSAASGSSGSESSKTGSLTVKVGF